MENIDLFNYIRQARKSGMGDDKIREGLLQAGWATADVEEAMAKVPAISASQTRPKAMMSKSLAVIFITVGVGVAVYFAGAYYMSKFQNFPLWPFEVNVPVPTFTSRPTPTNLEVELPSDTSGWLTYRNEEYGFEFRYPGDWQIPDRYFEINLINLSNGKDHIFNENEHTVDCNGREGIAIIMRSINKQSFDDEIKSLKDMADSPVLSNAISSFNGHVAYEIDNVREDSWCMRPKVIAVKINDRKYLTILLEGENIVDQILSTFRFTK